MKKENRRIVYLIYSIVFVLLVIRVHFSMYNGDEAYYLAMTNRLIQGDLMIVDEWSQAQFFALVLLPFMYIYKLCIPSYEGVYLYFRIIMLIYILFTSIRTFQVLRKDSVQVAFFSGLSILLYARGNNLGFQYYTVFMLSVWNSYMLLIEIQEGKYNRRINVKKAFFSGVFSGVATLTMPYFSLFIIVIFLIVLFKNQRSREKNILLGAYLCGVVVIAIPTLVRLGKSIKSPLFKTSLNQIAHSGGAHEISSSLILKKEIDAIEETLVLCFGIGGKLAYIRGGILLCIFLLLLSRKKIDAENVVIFSLSIFLCMSRIPTCIKQIGWMQVVFSFCVFPLVIDAIKKKIKMPAHIIQMYVLGFMVSICFVMGSDQKLECYTIGAAIQFMSSLFILEAYCRTIKEKMPKAFIIGINALVIMMFMIMSITRFFGVCGDADIIRLKYRIEKGPWKGVYTTEQQKNNYNAVIDTIEGLKEYKNEATVLYSAILPWAYLYSDFGYATPRGWRIEINSDRLLDWCEIHNKYPDICVIFNENIGGNEGSLFNTVPERPDFNKNELSGDFWNMLNDSYEIQYKTDCALVFIKN